MAGLKNKKTWRLSSLTFAIIFAIQPVLISIAPQVLAEIQNEEIIQEEAPSKDVEPLVVEEQIDENAEVVVVNEEEKEESELTNTEVVEETVVETEDIEEDTTSYEESEEVKTINEETVNEEVVEEAIENKSLDVTNNISEDVETTEIDIVTEVEPNESIGVENESAWIIDSVSRIATTKENVELNKEYVFPFNNKVTVKFSRLPATSSNIVVREIELTSEEISTLGATYPFAYEITTSMINGTFTYDLTLPNPTYSNTVNVEYSESRNELPNSLEVNNELSFESDIVKITNLEHFTVFVVVSPNTAGNGNPSADNCSTVGIVGDPVCYDTIQAAINAAQVSVGADVINILNGTYAECLSITGSDITITGESQAGVVLNTTACPSYGFSIGAVSNISVSNLTLNGPTGGAASNYGFKIAGTSNLTLSDITAQNSSRSNIDLNGVTNGSLTDITSTGAVAGVGIALTDSNDITLTNITTSGNAWAGIALYTNVIDFSEGISNILFTGTNSFSEPVQVYGEEADNTRTIDNVTFISPTFSYAVRNINNNFVVFFDNLTNALNNALLDPTNSYVNDIATNEFYLAPGMTIQTSIDVSENGDVLNFLAGTYTESIEVTKDLTLLGANNGIDGNGVRGAETILNPQAGEWYGVYIPTSGAGSTIDGFEISGDTAVDHYKIAGENTDALTIQNNVISDSEYGIFLWGGNQSKHTITNNYLTSFSLQAIHVRENNYADITNNFIDDSNVGIVTENFYASNPSGSATIENNTIYADRIGIRSNLHYTFATPFIIQNNDIYSNSVVANSRGIEVISMQTAAGVSVLNNTINGAFSYGIELWNNPTTGTITIDGNSIDGSTVGVWMTNNHPTFGPSDGDNNITLSNTTITNTQTGIRLTDDATNVNVSGLTLTLSNADLSNISGDAINLNGADTNIVPADLSLSNIGGQYFLLENLAPTDIDALAVTFAGLTGNQMTQALRDAVDAKNTDDLDDANLGLVIYYDQAALSSLAPTITDFGIQRAGGWNNGLILDLLAHFDSTSTYPIIGGNVTLSADFEDADDNLLTTRLGVHAAWFEQTSDWNGIPEGIYDFDWNTLVDARYNYTTAATDTTDGLRRVLFAAQDGVNPTIINDVSEEYYVIVDNTLPVVTYGALTPADGSTVSGTITIDGDFSDNYGLYDVRLGINGVSWNCYFGPTDQYTNDTPADGNYTCDIDTTALADGDYTIAIQGLDKAGNTQNIVTRQITVDNTPAPIVTIDDAFAQIVNGYACGVGSAISNDGLQVDIQNWDNAYVLQGRYYTAGGSYTAWTDISGWGTFVVNGTDATLTAMNSGNSVDGAAGWEIRVVDSGDLNTAISNVDNLDYYITVDLDSLACGGEITLGFETAENTPQTGTGECTVFTNDLTANGGTASLQILRWEAITEADFYVLDGYSWNGAAWVAQYADYVVPAADIDTTTEPGYVIYAAYATPEGRFAYTVSAYNNGTDLTQSTLDDLQVGQSEIIDNTLDCSFTVDRSAPAAPLFWVEEDTTSVLINWNDVADANTYNIYKNGILLANVAGNINTYTDSTVAANTSYTYEIRSVDISLNESVAQTAKVAFTLDIVIDDSSMSSDLGSTGTTSFTGTWTGYDVSMGGYAADVLQNAVGGDNYSITGNGETFTWTGGNLVNGVYEVYVQFICDSTRGDASYSVFADAAQLNAAPIIVAQSTLDGTTVCGAQTAVSEAGPTWISLGTYQFNDVIPSVVLTADVGESNILADAVGFEFIRPVAPILTGWKQVGEPNDNTPSVLCLATPQVQWTNDTTEIVDRQVWDYVDTNSIYYVRQVRELDPIALTPITAWTVLTGMVFSDPYMTGSSPFLTTDDGKVFETQVFAFFDVNGNGTYEVGTDLTSDWSNSCYVGYDETVPTASINDIYIDEIINSSADLPALETSAATSSETIYNVVCSYPQGLTYPINYEDAQNPITVDCTFEDRAGNTGTTTYDVIIQDVVPAVNISTAPGNSTTLQAITLTANGSGGNPALTYAWSGGNFANCTGTTVSIVTPATPGTYTCTVTVTDADGDTATANISVTVNNAIVTPTDLTPSVTISATPGTSTTVQAITLTANGTGGDGTLTYAWSGGNFANCTGTTTSVVTPATAGTYTCTVTVTDADGDTDTATITVTVNPGDSLPTVVIITNPADSTTEQAITLTAVASNGDGALTYSWGGGNFAGCAGTGQSVSTPTAPGTYTCTVTVTDADGDSISATKTVVVNAAVSTGDLLPTVILFGNSPAQNNSGIINVSANTAFTIVANLNNLGNPNYNFTFSGVCSGSITNSGSASLTSNTLSLAQGTYTCFVTVTDTDGDTAQASVSIVVSGGSVQGVSTTTTTTTTTEPIETTTEEEEDTTGDVLGESDVCEVENSITGFVYMSNNDNGFKDSDEEGLESITVSVYYFDEDNKRLLLDTDKTDANGFWSVDACPGDYEVEITTSQLPEKTELNGNAVKKVTLSSTKDLTNINFEILEQKSNSNLNWLWIVLAIIAFILFLLLLARRRNSQENN